MRLSIAWLRELVTGLEATPSEIASRLTHCGLEVEAMTEVGTGLEPVRLAKVESIEPHPSRSGLRLVTVDRGGGQQQIVCGASNVPEPGGLVVLAPVGTVLPGIGELTPREIGGVRSEGMLLSEAELGLSESSDGILVFEPDRFAPGTPLLEAFPGIRDTLLDVGVTPNRPDALGHVGVARELAALFELPFRFPEAPAPRRVAEGRDASDLVSVENRDTERCPVYAAGVVVDVTVGPSPEWLRWRLGRLGVRPISNVVDVTNLMLLGFGQPMHAFDLALVRSSRIVVRRAVSGEAFTTLDGVARTLDEDDLVIADGERPSALAGVMGGQESEIRDDTRTVLLECAYFQPRGVRRTGRRHGLSTESSFRFERGVDFGAIPSVLEHAKAWLSELCGGRVVSGQVCANGPTPELPSIRLRSTRMDALLGAQVPFVQATNLLERLGFPERASGSTADGGRFVEVSAVSWRPDVRLEVDLIEEVARVWGLDQIPTVLPAIPPQAPRATGKLERSVLERATALGLSEAVAHSTVSEKQLAELHAPAAVVSLQNPLSEDRRVLRTSLLPGLLDAVVRARRHGERSVRLFSVGSVFLAPRGDSSSDARPRMAEDRGALPEERPMFAAVLSGTRPAHLAQPEPVDVWDAKGIATEIALHLTARVPSVELATGASLLPHLHPRGAGILHLDGQPVGTFGPLHPDVLDALDTDGELYAVELDLAALERFPARVPRFRPLPRVPAVTRDLALVVRETVSAKEVEQLIVSSAGELCESVQLFDLFQGGSVPEGHRSLAFHIVYRDPKASTAPEAARTLTDREVDLRHAEVVQAMSARFGAELRA